MKCQNGLQTSIHSKGQNFRLLALSKMLNNSSKQFLNNAAQNQVLRSNECLDSVFNNELKTASFLMSTTKYILESNVKMQCKDIIALM